METPVAGSTPVDVSSHDSENNPTTDQFECGEPCWLGRKILPPQRIKCPRSGDSPWNFVTTVALNKTRIMPLPEVGKEFDERCVRRFCELSLQPSFLLLIIVVFGCHYRWKWSQRPVSEKAYNMCKQMSIAAGAHSFRSIYKAPLNEARWCHTIPR